MTDVTMTANEAAMFEAFANANPQTEQFRKADFVSFAVENGFAEKEAHQFLNTKVERVKRGVYTMSLGNVKNIVPMPRKAVTQPAPAIETPAPKAKVKSTVNSEVYIPEKIKEFVRWGYFKDVKQVIESRMFFPMFVAGLSGNGKTMMIEQACALSKREYVRVQITPETDEDDLIGGFRLLDGETVFAKGPVIKAMEAGAILLIDEIDRGSNKLMALQGVLEGKPVLIKKTGEVVTPAPGFNVIATANTKGQGDEAGRFIAATIIDEAFLERFNVTLEQPYPTASVEKKIVINHMDKFGSTDEEFAENLVKWGQAIRSTFEDGGVDDIISTRRLCHIVQTFAIFNDKKKAIELCVNRFDADTRAAFVDLYEKIDAGMDDANTATDGAYSYGAENDGDDSPF
jgi:MoxR-like ATPase